ncbi:hypothetical protein M9458_008936, partial [Cirrhinus mrigala]
KGHHPDYLLLLLEQKGMPLEVHSTIFVEITNHSSFPDSSLCTFFPTSLNRGGPWDSFVAFVEWVLVSNIMPYTIGPTKERLTSPTSDPEPSPPSTRFVELQPEPTTDEGPQPIATHQPAQEGATELGIALEPESHQSSDQVQKPSTSLAPVVVTVEREVAEKSPAHCTTGGEQTQDSGDYVDEYANIPCLLPSDELSEYPKIPPDLTPPLLDFVPPSVVWAHHG